MLHRQGDVLLKPVKNIPLQAKKMEDKTLQYGEVTGHSHRFDHSENIDRFNFGERVFLQVREASTLIHEEHGPQVISPGVYEQIQEREWDYIEEDMRRVVD